MCVSSYCYILLYMCPHPTLYCSICVLILLHATASKSLLQRCCSDDNMCPHTHIATYCHICVLILLYTALCVRILQRATATGKSLFQRLVLLPRSYICVRMLMLLYMCHLQQASRCCSGWPRCRFTRTRRALQWCASSETTGMPMYVDVCRRMPTYAAVC